MPSRDAASQRDNVMDGICRLSSLDPALLLNAGNRLCEQECFEEAVAVYRAALSLSSVGALYVILLSNLGMAHLEMRQAEIALTDFDAALVALAALLPGQSDAALLEDMHRIALTGKAQAQAQRKDSQ